MTGSKKKHPGSPQEYDRNKLPRTSKLQAKNSININGKNGNRKLATKKYNVPLGYVVNGKDQLVLPPQQKSQNSKSPSPARSITPKNDIQPATQPQVSQRTIKPIAVDANYNVWKQLLDVLKLPTRTQILCKNLDDKLKTITELKAKKILFHSYAEPGERNKVFVLKNFYRLETEELQTILQNDGIPATKTSFLVDHAKRPVYLVHFEDQTMNVNILQHQHKAVENLIVRWDRYNPRMKRPMPCRKCKMWGHAASSCGREYRCIKCTNKHAPGECLPTPREGTAKCVNCDGDHAANHIECPSYIAYQKGLQRRNRAPPRRSQTQPRLQQQQYVSDTTTGDWPSVGRPAPFAQISNFSQGHNVNTLSYSAAVSGSQNISGSRDLPLNSSQSRNVSFGDLHAQFATIPGIGHTMEL